MNHRLRPLLAILPAVEYQLGADPQGDVGQNLSSFLRNPDARTRVRRVPPKRSRPCGRVIGVQQRCAKRHKSSVRGHNRKYENRIKQIKRKLAHFLEPGEHGRIALPVAPLTTAPRAPWNVHPFAPQYEPRTPNPPTPPNRIPILSPSKELAQLRGFRSTGHPLPGLVAPAGQRTHRPPARARWIGDG